MWQFCFSVCEKFLEFAVHYLLQEERKTCHNNLLWLWKTDNPNFQYIYILRTGNEKKENSLPEDIAMMYQEIPSINLQRIDGNET